MSRVDVEAERAVLLAPKDAGTFDDIVTVAQEDIEFVDSISNKVCHMCDLACGSGCASARVCVCVHGRARM
jgi:hypothetical protein